MEKVAENEELMESTRDDLVISFRSSKDIKIV